jgi:Immunoglobulin-like domain of bacterial spore germination/Sporulation and spore germination
MTSRTRLRLAAAMFAAAALVLGGCGTDQEPEASDPSGGAGSTSEPEPQPATDPPAPSQSASAPQTVAVPVYFVGRTPLGPRLFREFRNVEGDNPVDEALALLASGDALDPDYSTLLPQGDPPTLVQDDTTKAIGINLPSLDWTQRPSGMSAAQAKLAVQQIVYTVQGALQTRAPVEFFYDGLAPAFGTKATVKAAKQNDVLALVNVTQPAEGATVTGTLQASGVANSFEATVPWEIRDQSGAKVLDGFSTAEGWADHLYPWQSQVDLSKLAPGTYSFVAMTDDPSDGEGAGPTEDSKTITVK